MTGQGIIACYPDCNYSYTYDSQGQLLSETIGDTTYTRTYDDAGNILTASDGTTTHTYTYGNSEWGDLLMAYDGEEITYDEIGNPTSYYNGTRWTLTWEHGRELITMKNGTDTLAFIYDENNIRMYKYVNDDIYTYYYDGDKLMLMTAPDYSMYFSYDADGRPYSCNYNGLQLYYVLNAQGDVVKLVDGTGESYGVYRYDAWGNIIYQSSHAWMAANPLRYRGYVYDEETGLYYCQSRYYDPQTGRFLNADAYATTGQGFVGNNMFAYCLNNPVLLKDKTGTYPHNAITTVSIEGQGLLVRGRALQTPAYSKTAHDINTFLSELFCASNPYAYLMEYDGLADSVAAVKVGAGIRKVKGGIGLIVTPMPTLLDEITGIGYVVWGFWSIITSIDELGD